MFQVNDLSQGLRPQHPCPPGALRGSASNLQNLFFHLIHFIIHLDLILIHSFSQWNWWVTFFKIFDGFFENVGLNKLWSDSKLLNFIYWSTSFYCTIIDNFGTLYVYVTLVKTYSFVDIVTKNEWFFIFFFMFVFCKFIECWLTFTVILIKYKNICFNISCWFNFYLLASTGKTEIFVHNAKFYNIVDIFAKKKLHHIVVWQCLNI